MATNNYALTTVQRVKDRLGITSTASDTVLTRIIYAVTDMIEDLCSNRFLQSTYTQEVYDGMNIDGTPKPYLFLNNAPVTTISSFQYRTGAKSSPTWVDFQVDTYQEVLELGIIRTGLPPGLQNIRISYTAGYLIDFTNENDPTKHTLPYDLSDLADRVATRLYKKRDSEGRSAESFNQSSITWKDGLLDDYDNTVIANHSRTEIV